MGGVHFVRVTGADPACMTKERALEFVAQSILPGQNQSATDACNTGFRKHASS